MFVGREYQNPNETKLRGSGSKLSNIREQNQNWSNLESVQCISVLFFLNLMIYFYFKNKRKKMTKLFLVKLLVFVSISEKLKTLKNQIYCSLIILWEKSLLKRSNCKNTS